MDLFVHEWHAHVKPLRLQFGFSVLGPWVADDGATFVWVVGHDGDFDAVDAAYSGSPERRGLEPDPSRLLVEIRTSLMRAPSPARARGR
jgi:hypothetical protein